MAMIGNISKSISNRVKESILILRWKQEIKHISKKIVKYSSAMESYQTELF